MTPLQRVMIYQRERFPLARTVPLLAVFSAASMNVSASLAGRPYPDAAAYAAGFVLATFALILIFSEGTRWLFGSFPR